MRLNVPLESILMSLYYQYHHLFFLLGAPLSIWEGFFAEMASGFQSLKISKRKFRLRSLTVFWMHFLNSTVMLLYYQHYYSFFIDLFYFIIPLFSHTRFNCFKWAFACYYLAFFSDVGSLCCLLWTIFSIFN